MNKIEHFSLNLKKRDSIQSETTEDGILLKGLPVFKAGVHRGNKFDRDFIDRNFIGQFEIEDDIPLQADHSASFKDTLGFIKKIERKGDFLLADILLQDDLAISRWNKGLLKKFSLGIDMAKDKIREISAVAFPFVKEAAVLGDSDYHVYETTPQTLTTNETASESSSAKFDTISVSVDGTEQVFVKQKEKSDEQLGLKISIEDDGLQDEVLTISEEDIANLDPKKDFSETGDFQEGSLPDSSFMLLKKPIKSKSKDRKMPFRGDDGMISMSHIKDNLATIEKLKGFGDDIKLSAKRLLTLIDTKFTDKKPVSQLSAKKRIKHMSLKDINLSEIEGDAKELIKEALENQESLEQEINTKDTQLAEAKSKVDELQAGLKKADVDKKVEALSNEGCITPAQKDATAELLLSMSDEQITKYVELASGQKAVDLGESDAEELAEEKKGDELDLEALDANEINHIAEKVAEQEKVEFSTALDWVYDGLVDSNCKVTKKAE